MRNHRRAAYGERSGYEKVATSPGAARQCRLPRSDADRTCQGGLGPRPRPRRAARLPQRPGHGDRADRHHRPGDGLRHHRHRAGLRAGEVQKACRRRLLQDHQPRGAGSAAHARLQRSRDRRDRGLCGRPRQRWRRRRRSTTPRSRPRASPTKRSTKVEKALPTAFDIKFAFNKWTLGEDFCRDTLGIAAEELADARLRPARRARLHQARDRGRQHPCLRRDDGRRRAAPRSPSTIRCSTAPIRAAAPASAISRSRATSA